jgi:flagellar biogenesis protein FliO
MTTLRNAESDKLNLIAAPEIQGFAGWVIALFRSWRSKSEMTQKRLRVVETLPLGGKRQLMLIACGGESFLVGGGLDSVETIVRVNAECSVDVSSKNQDESCR